MTLADLRDGDRVFMEADIFICHFGGRSLECKALLERCPSRTAWFHFYAGPCRSAARRMVAEAIAKGLVTARTAVRRLGKPGDSQTITQYQERE